MKGGLLSVSDCEKDVRLPEYFKIKYNSLFKFYFGIACHNNGGKIKLVTSSHDIMIRKTLYYGNKVATTSGDSKRE